MPPSWVHGLWSIQQRSTDISRRRRHVADVKLASDCCARLLCYLLLCLINRRCQSLFGASIHVHRTSVNDCYYKLTGEKAFDSIDQLMVIDHRGLRDSKWVSKPSRHSTGRRVQKTGSLLVRKVSHSLLVRPSLNHFTTYCYAFTHFVLSYQY